MTSIDMDSLPPAKPTTPVSVQVLGMILFAGFAIPVTIVTLVHFWPAGVVLAIILGWRGTFAFGQGSQTSDADLAMIMEAMRPDAKPKASGNASFDRYRDDMLDRLEMEQENFETFLDRLRDAKDKVEFDNFMEDRARKLSQDT